MAHQQYFSSNQAAKVCGVSRTTMQRRLAASAIPGAEFNEASQTWRIPLDGLIAAGFSPTGLSTGPGERKRKKSAQEKVESDQLLLQKDHEIELLRQQIHFMQQAARAKEETLQSQAKRIGELERQLPAARPASASTADDFGGGVRSFLVRLLS